MDKPQTKEKIAAVIDPEELLKHWQGHRGLTRKVIEAFPDKEFFDYSIGGMRPFSKMVQELLDISAPGIRQMAGGEAGAITDGHTVKAKSKAEVLALWDEATEEINKNWVLIPLEKFHETILSFGQYEGLIWSNIFYFIDNEVHHRAQAYVYLRAMGIEPPAFWDR